MKNKYWSIIENDISRFLAQLDCNPISSTYGSFDRSYWHHRRTDFSSASLQQGVLVLALLYSDYYEGNQLYQKTEIIDWIEAALNYTAKIQHSDGSLDEWYPQERGWAGPTGYVLYSVIQSLELVADKLRPETIQHLKIFSRKAIRHLLKYEESDILSNHQAMAILAVEAANKYFQFNIEITKEKIWRRFLQSFSSEGWSLEYDGCDPGYQTATLSFLSRLHRLLPSDQLKDLCEKQIKFLKMFLLPDDSFAGSVGSRGTANIFHFGFEYWAASNSDANYLASRTFSGVQKGTLLRPGDQEDHYLIYRLVEFLEAARITSNLPTIHWQHDTNNHYLPESTILKINTNSMYGFLNLSKNATGRVFNLQNSKIDFEDAGYFFEDSRGNQYTSSFVQQSRIISVTENKIILDGYFNRYRRPKFSSFNFWLFRTALLAVRSSRLAYYLKSWIRSRIMTNFKVTTLIKIRREITLNPTFKISDTIQIKGIQIHKAFRSRNFPSRSVPQSLYFGKNSLIENSVIPLGENIDRLNRHKKIDLDLM